MDFTGELCAALAGDKRFITAEGGLDVSHVVEAARAQDEQLIVSVPVEGCRLSDVRGCRQSRLLAAGEGTELGRCSRADDGRMIVDELAGSRAAW